MDSAELSKAFGMMTLEELEYLKAVLDEGEDQPLVANVGTGAGTSLLAILEARPTAEVVTVDKLPTSAPGYLRDAGFGRAKVEFITADSVDAAVQVAGREFDVVVIDASSMAEDVQADLKAWGPLVRDDGIILVHDYGTDHPTWEAIKAVTDRYARYYGLQKTGQAGSLASFIKGKAKPKAKADV